MAAEVNRIAAQVHLKSLDQDRSRISPKTNHGQGRHKQENTTMINTLLFLTGACVASLIFAAFVLIGG